MPELNQHAACNAWLLGLTALVGGAMSTEDLEDTKAEYLDLLLPEGGIPMFDGYVWGAITQNGSRLNRASLGEVASHCPYWPTFGKLCDELRKWIEAHPKKAMIEAPKPAAATYHDPRLAELSPTEKSWMAYYQKREADGFAPIGQSVVSTRQPGEPEKMHKLRLRNHVLSLVRANAPKTWAIIISENADAVGVDPEALAEKERQEGRCAGLNCIDHPDRRSEAREVDNYLFGTWDSDGKLLEPGTHPFDRGPAAYQAWKSEMGGGYVSLERRMEAARMEAAKR